MKYDLGNKSQIAGCCSAPSECNDEKTYYPSLYISGDKKLGFPDEGTATITFRKVSSGEDQRDGEEPHYRCELEVHSIEVTEAKVKEDGMVSVGTAMREAMKKKIKEKQEEY
jgi:hypothetical protein